MIERIRRNPTHYIGRMGQVRLPAYHRWLIDRQGIHCALGMAAASFCLLGFELHWGWFIISALVLLRFLVYERVEDLKINDHDYLDIGGEFAGFLVVSLGYGAHKGLDYMGQLYGWEVLQQYSEIAGWAVFGAGLMLLGTKLAQGLEKRKAEKEAASDA